MKIIYSWFILLGLLSMLTYAAIEVESVDLKITADYEKLRDNDKKLSISSGVTLTNKGTVTESITLSFQDLSSEYELSVSPTALQLAAGGSQDVTISGKIPINVDQGTKEIGKLKLVTTSGQNSLFPLTTDVKPMFEIKKIIVNVNGQPEKTIADDNEDVKKLEPGDKVELRFQLENLFDEDYDFGDISGTITLNLDDSEFGEDIDLEEEFDVDAGLKLDSNNEEVVFPFIIPEKAENGEYTLDIKVEGKDENKAEYEEKWKLNLEVERKKDDIRIQSFTVTPAEVSCVRRAEVIAKVTNFGTSREKHAALSIVNPDLSINLKYDFELNDGTSDDNSIIQQSFIEVGSKVKAGTYPIVATAFYDFNAYSDKQIADLVVKACNGSATTGAESINNTAINNQSSLGTTNQSNTLNDGATLNNNGQQIVTTGTAKENSNNAPATKQTPSQTSLPIVTIIENPYLVQDYILAGTIVAIALIMIIIVLFVVILFRT